MSDATNQGEPDFRGNRETKRRDETVMLGSDAMASMVDEAKTAPPAAASSATDTAPAAVDGEQASGTRLIILAVGAILVLGVVIALVYSWAS